MIKKLTKIMLITIILILSTTTMHSLSNIFLLSYAQPISNGLNVTALSEDVIAAPGNRLPNYIIVSVTDHYGRPITGLEISNFKLDAMIVGPGGAALVNITRALEGRLPGTYILYVVPTKMDTWQIGVYIFAIAVFNAPLQGQTLASVLMD